MFKIGARGEGVKELQRKLLKSGYKLEVDGVYGPVTNSIYNKFVLDSKNSNIDTLSSDILKFANSYVGQEEIKGNLGFKNPWFHKLMIGVGFQRTHPWCAYFTELCWKEGYKTNTKNDIEIQNILGKLFSASVMQTRNNFIKNGKVYGFELSKFPSPGALIIYQSATNKSFGHIGVVEKIFGEAIHTIEGNTDINGSREGFIVAKKIRRLDFTVRNKGLNLIGFINPVTINIGK